MNTKEFNNDNLEIDTWLFEYKNTQDEKVKKRLRGFIAVAYLPLVAKVAKSFARRSNDPVEDIIQVGSIGLLKALDFYSSEKNSGFKTYATYLITGEIRHYLRDKSSMIRAPREIKELSYRVNKLTMELTQKYGAPPTDEQLAQALQMPQKKIEEVIDLDRRTTAISIDQNLNSEFDDEKNIGLIEKIPDENTDKYLEIFEDKMILDGALNSLPDEDRQIIKMCFWEGLNNREISQKLNISQMKVSRKMKKALIRLFNFVTSHGVHSYE